MVEDKAVWFRNVLYQGNDGLILEAYAHPKIENYFAMGGEATPLSGGSRTKWFSPDKKPILVYPYENGGNNGELEYADGYTIHPVGYDFTTFQHDLGYPQETFNLSFLRLAGISSGDGVKIGIKQPSSDKGRKMIRLAMEQAVRKFIRNTFSTSRYEFTILAKEIG